MPKCGCFSVHTDGTVFIEEIVVVPKEGDLREVIMKEAHDSKLSIPLPVPRCTRIKQTFGGLV